MTLTRLMNLPYRLSAEQKAWLKGMQKDKCSEIAEAAQMVYAEHFPYAERNARKQQLHISEMTFVVQDELWDEYGDSFDAQIMFILDRKTRLISCTQAGASNTIELTAKEMRKLLNRIVNAYEVFCWEEDCALPGFVDSKNEEKTERNAGYLVVSHSGGGMLRQGTRKGIRRTPANRGMRAHWVVKGLDISEDVCHGMCP